MSVNQALNFVERGYQVKVLYATYPMAFHTPGGGEIQLLSYKKYLEEVDIEISLFDMWKPEFLKHDVVHFFSCVGGSIPFCQFVKDLGLPLVITSSLWITHETKHLYPFNEIRHQLSLADRIIANSDIECNTLAKVLNLPREKFFTVYNGVDPVFFEPASGSDFIAEFKIKAPFVLNVGNIEPRKNQLRLAEAMKAYPDYKLILIGHARDQKYHREVLDMGGGQIIDLGPLPHDSYLLRSAFKACALFALPSTLETPGLAALEASALGARLLITYEGSTREYFGESAVYVDPHSAESIREKIAVALAQGKYVKLTDQRYNWRNTVNGLSNLYKTLI